MITEIRRRFKKYGFQVVLWMTTIAMFITLLPMLFDSGPRAQTAVKVNGQEVTMPEYAWRLQHEKERIEQFRGRFGAQADMYLSMFGMDNPEKNALDGLVQDSLMDQAADKTRLVVDQTTVARKLNDPQFTMTHLMNVVPMQVIDPRTGLIHPEALRQYLAQNRMSQEFFDASIERALRASTLMGLVAGSVYVDPSDLKEFYERTTLGRSYGVITLPLDNYTKKAEAGITDEKLQNVFAAHKAQYMVPEKRSGQVIQFAPAAFGIAISDEQAKAEYERNKHKKYMEAPAQFQYRSIALLKDPKNGFTDEVRERAQKVEELVKKNPAQFATLAKEHSQDKNLSAKGGLSEWMTREQIKPEVRRALFAMKDDGEVSELITTKDGFEIIQRTGRKAIQYKPFDSVKSAIVARLERQQFQNAFEREARQAIRQASSDPKALEQFIAQKGGVKQPYKDVVRGDDTLSRAFFAGKQGDWQATLVGDNGVLVNVTTVAKRHEPAFEDVKQVVTKDYVAQRAQELLDADLKKAATLAKDQSLEQVARALGGSYQVTPRITQADQAEVQKLTKSGIPAEKLLALTGKGAHESFVQGKNGYFAQVTEVAPFDQAQFEAKKEAIAQQLYQEEIARKQRSLVASLYRNATLDLSDQINLQPKA